MSLAVKCLAEPVRTVAFGGISGTYAAIGTPFAHPARAILFQNLTNAVLMFSLNGVDDHFPIQAMGYFVLDVSSNRDASSDQLYVATGTVVWVKQVGVAGSGSVYVSVFYGE